MWIISQSLILFQASRIGTAIEVCDPSHVFPSRCTKFYTSKMEGTRSKVGDSCQIIIRDTFHKWSVFIRKALNKRWTLRLRPVLRSRQYFIGDSDSDLGLKIPNPTPTPPSTPTRVLAAAKYVQAYIWIDFQNMEQPVELVISLYFLYDSVSQPSLYNDPF